MKYFLQSFIALTMLLTASTWAKDVEHVNYSCALESIAQAKMDLVNADSKKQFFATADDISLFLNTCRATVFPTAITPKNQIEDFYSVIKDVLAAQLKTEKIHDCIKLGATTTEPWDSTYKSIKDSPDYSAIQKTIASCKAKREKEIDADFVAEKCPLFGSSHKYSKAIAVPAKWKLNTKGAACLYLYTGKNLSKPEEEGIHLRENYPHLILLTMEGEDMYEQFIDFNQGELASKDICLSGRIEGVDFLSTSGNAKNPLIRIKSYSEHCLRDSASFAIDSVYKVDREKGLIPVNELSITLHE